eukprot:scaffold79193_cov63-Phaeocystis_antarctica.AAC.5
MLLAAMSVSGWRLISVSLLTCRSSSRSGFASSSLPTSCSSLPTRRTNIDVTRSAAGSRASTACA